MRGVLLKEGQDREGPARQRCWLGTAGLQQRGCGGGERSGTHPGGHRGSGARSKGFLEGRGGPEVPKGGGDRARSAPVIGGMHSWAFLCKCQAHPTRGEVCGDRSLP